MFLGWKFFLREQGVGNREQGVGGYLLLGSVGVENGRVSWGSEVFCFLELTPSARWARPPKTRGQLERSCSCDVLFETESPIRRM